MLDANGSYDFFQWKGIEEDYPTELFEKLATYDAILWAIHSDKVPEYPEIQTLTTTKESHFCFFIAPYRLSKYAAHIPAAQSILLAYENTEPAQKTAAQIHTGRLPAKGRLPVTLAGLFGYGAGEELWVGDGR
jgi:hypothetical protein